MKKLISFLIITILANISLAYAQQNITANLPELLRTMTFSASSFPSEYTVLHIEGQMPDSTGALSRDELFPGKIYLDENYHAGKFISDAIPFYNNIRFCVKLDLAVKSGYKQKIVQPQIRIEDKTEGGLRKFSIELLLAKSDSPVNSGSIELMVLAPVRYDSITIAAADTIRKDMRFNSLPFRVHLFNGENVFISTNIEAADGGLCEWSIARINGRITPGGWRSMCSETPKLSGYNTQNYGEDDVIAEWEGPDTGYIVTKLFVINKEAHSITLSAPFPEKAAERIIASAGIPYNQSVEQNKIFLNDTLLTSLKKSLPFFDEINHYGMKTWTNLQKYSYALGSIGGFQAKKALGIEKKDSICTSVDGNSPAYNTIFREGVAKAESCAGMSEIAPDLEEELCYLSSQKTVVDLCAAYLYYGGFGTFWKRQNIELDLPSYYRGLLDEWDEKPLMPYDESIRIVQTYCR